MQRIIRLTKKSVEFLKIGMRTIDRVKKRFVEDGLEAALKMAPTSRMYERLVDGTLRPAL